MFELEIQRGRRGPVTGSFCLFGYFMEDWTRSAVVLECVSGGGCVCGAQPAVTQLQECPNEATAAAAGGWFDF